MSIETIQKNEAITYSYDSEGVRRAWTPYELEQIELRKQLKDFLQYSSLTDDDRQRLRGISADYVMICSQLREDDRRTRHTVLNALLADIPEASEADATGLRRLSSKLHGPTVIVDGYPMPVSELEVVYSLIKPSKELLDRAVNDAAYFYVAEDDFKQTESLPTLTTRVDVDVQEVLVAHIDKHYRGTPERSVVFDFERHSGIAKQLGDKAVAYEITVL